MNTNSIENDEELDDQDYDLASKKLLLAALETQFLYLY